MAINTKALSKGEVRKLTALRKSLGNDIANEAFEKWLKNKPTAAAAKEDLVAVKIEEALARYAKNKDFKLGNYGYTIRRAKGKGASGFVATRNEKPDAKIAAARKSPLKSHTAKKAVAKKTTAKKSSAKTATVKKTIARKSPAKKQTAMRVRKAA